MATCENCGVSFAPPSGPVEVTSTRVLCAKCTAERRAEKARRAAQQDKAGGQPTLSMATQPAVRKAAPVPASKPREAPVAKPLPKPAPRVEPKPAPVKPAAKAAPPPPPPRKRNKEHDEDLERGKRLLKQQESRVVVAGWGIAVVLCAVAGVAVFKVRSKQAHEKAVAEEHRQAVASFWTKMQEFDIATDLGAQQAIQLADKESALWRGETIEGDVQSKVSKAKTNIESNRERDTQRKSLADIEEALKDPESLSAEFLAEQRRKIEELEPRARVELVGSEFIARLGTLRANTARIYAAKLLQEVKGASSSDPTRGREALARFARAEEEIQKMFDRAIKDKDAEAKTYYEGLYREVINESDALAEQVFTEETIEKVQWTDLLSGDQVQKWRAANVKGFEHRIEKGVLYIKGPDADTNKKGVMAIGKEERWRDFVLDMEYTLTKGSIDMYFRMSVQPDQNVELFTLSTEGTGAVNAGETYSAKVSMIGSKFTYEDEQSGGAPTDVSWTKNRAGEICFVIPDGTELKFSRLKIRALR